MNGILVDLATALNPLLRGRGAATLGADGGSLTLVPRDSGTVWVIVEWDGPDAVMMLGGVGAKLGIVAYDGSVESMVEQVVAVLDGCLVEFVDTSRGGAVSVGYELVYPNGSASQGVLSGASILPIRHSRWSEPEAGRHSAAR